LRRCAVVATISIAIALLASATANAAPVGENQAEAELSRLALAKFSPLSQSEARLVLAAAHRDLKWLGPSDDPSDPSNDLNQAGTWPAARIVRADLVRWLASDPEAAPLVHPSGLGFAGARIAGTLDLSFTHVDKPITMVRVCILDGIDLRNSHLAGIEIRRSLTGPIIADNSDIAGDVTIQHGSHGAMSFFRSHISGNLDLSDSKVSGRGMATVTIIEANIGGDVGLQEGFSTDGLIDARLAEIHRALTIHQASFTGDGRTGLDAERARIGASLYWTEIQHTPQTILNLSDAKAEALVDDAASWPAPGNLMVGGFVYSSFGSGPGEASQRLRWLNLQPVGYTPQPYRQLAQVLRESGRDSASLDVLIAKEVALRRNGHLGVGEKIWNYVLEVTIGYGYRPLRALWWILGFVLFGAAVFRFGYRALVITPTDEVAYEAFVRSGHPPVHYPRFNPLIYSLENFLPVVDLHQDSYWRPNVFHAIGGKLRHPTNGFPRGGFAARIIQAYLWLHVLAGWMITPLLFVGLSGLVRPD
jgi:hypothetical protein